MNKKDTEKAIDEARRLTLLTLEIERRIQTMHGAVIDKCDEIIQKLDQLKKKRWWRK